MLFSLLFALNLHTQLMASTPSCPPTHDAGYLIIHLDNIRHAKGIIRVGIYDSEKHFMQEGKAVSEAFTIDKTGSTALRISNLAFGAYAVAIFHDLNENGRLDTNALGIPSEPFAFSKKAVSKFRAPRFEEIRFDFKENGQVLHTRLEKWWE